MNYQGDRDSASSKMVKDSQQKINWNVLGTSKDDWAYV